jgi:hypothetical protein
MTTDQFDNPGTTTALNLEQLLGALLLIKPSRVEANITTVRGPADATVADVHVLDGPSRGELFADAFVWARVLQSQLRSTVGTGRYVLGRLAQGIAKSGQTAPWILQDPTEPDKHLARKYLAELAASPITTPDNGDDCPF